jgi:hypothetical protein
LSEDLDTKRLNKVRDGGKKSWQQQEGKRKRSRNIEGENGFKEQKTQLGQIYNLPRAITNVLGKLYVENNSP